LIASCRSYLIFITSKKKCLKAINLLRVVAHTQQTLLQLYRSLIRSKLDCSCIVYGSARPSYLKIQDPIHSHALRLCLGAFRISLAISLCVQATEPTLALRRKKLALQYCLKLSANTNNPAYNAVFNSKFKTQIFRVKDDLQNLGFKEKNVLPTTVSTIPLWLLKRPNCSFSLCCYDKTTTNQEVFKRKYFELRSEFSHHLRSTQMGPKIELEQLPLLLHLTLSKQFAYLTMLVFLLLKFMHWTWR